MIFTDTENKMIYTSEDELAHNSSHRVPIEPDVLVPHPANESKLLIYSYIEQKVFVFLCVQYLNEFLFLSSLLYE